MDRETLKEKIAGRLRSLFPSYKSTEPEDALYMVREADQRRVVVGHNFL